jgi:2'-5' RNA ligase
MRLFVCTFLNGDNQPFYGRLASALVAAGAGSLRPIPSGSAHVTYAFLRDVEAERQGDVVEAMETVAPLHPPIAIRLGPPEVRYARARPRLVSVDVIDGGSIIQRLTADVAAELMRRCPGTIVDQARSPHVTIARFWRHAGREATRAVAGEVSASPWAHDTRPDLVSRMQVVSSALTPQGPVYAVVADIPLGGAA